MKHNVRIIEGDERTLILLNVVLHQGMSVQEAFCFLNIDDKKDFIHRNNLEDKLKNKTELINETAKLILKYAEANRKKLTQSKSNNSNSRYP